MADGRRSRPIQDNFRPFAPDDCICDLGSIRCTEAAGTEKPIRRPPARPFLRHFSPAAEERLRYGRSSLIRSGAWMRRDRQVCGHRVPDGLRPWQDPAKAEIFPAMLPGFRFLFAAVVM